MKLLIRGSSPLSEIRSEQGAWDNCTKTFRPGEWVEDGITGACSEECVKDRTVLVWKQKASSISGSTNGPESEV